MSAATAPAWVLVEHADGVREHVRLSLSLTTIGRSDQNVIELLDPKLSRFHCEIERRGGTYRLRDCNSRNGTFVNGLPARLPLPLQHDDKIALGKTEITFLTKRPQGLYPERADQVQELPAEGSEQSKQETKTRERRPTRGFDPRQTVTLEMPLPQGDNSGPWRLLAVYSQELLEARNRGHLLGITVEGARLMLQSRGILLALCEDADPEQLGVAASQGLDAEGKQRCLELARRALLKQDLVIQNNLYMALPLEAHGKKLGALVAKDLPREPRSHSDEVKALRQLVLLAATSMATQLGQEEVRREERRAAAERLAQDLLQKIRPEELPACPGIEVGVARLAGTEVGADFWDAFLTGEPQELYLTVGDIEAELSPMYKKQGQGSLVSLVGQAGLLAALRALAGTTSSPAKMLQRVHESLCWDGLSLLLLRYSPDSGSLVWSGAGKVPLLWYRHEEGRVTTCSSESPTLRLGASPRLAEHELKWESGDRLLVVSPPGMKIDLPAATRRVSFWAELLEEHAQAGSCQEIASAIVTQAEQRVPHDLAHGLTIAVLGRS